MDILRASDNQNNPIFEAEDQGYEKGDPEDPNDDNYIYLIRRYRLEDFVFMGESKDASEGEVWLYNPDLEKVGTWEISSLQCLNHDNECDGLHAVYEEGHDTRHALLVPVPVSMMEYAGTYIFVLRIKDNHPELYRDHQHRWTLELNATSRPAGVCVYKGSRLDLYKDITESWNALKDRWLAVFNPFTNRWEYQRITDGMTRELDGRFHVAKNVNCNKSKECVLSSLQYGSYTRVGGQVNRHSPPIWILFAHGFGGYAMECKKKQALVSTHAKGLEMEEDGWQYCAVSSLPAGSLTSLQLAVLLGCETAGTGVYSLPYQLRAKGANLVIGINRTIDRRILAQWLRYFVVGDPNDFKVPGLLYTASNGQVVARLDYQSVKTAATGAMNKILSKVGPSRGASNYILWAQLGKSTDSFIVLYSPMFPDGELLESDSGNIQL